MRHGLSLMFLIILCFLGGCVSVSGDTPVIYDKPVIRSFSASPAVIDQGASSTLSWNVAGATNVYIDQGVGNVALTGSTSIAPPVTVIYTLTAQNSFGKTTARTQVTVRGTAGPISPPSTSGNQPSINYFTANPAAVTAGSPVTLSWSIFGATDITITPEIAPPEAEMSVTIFPAATTVYTLTASNSAGTVTRQVTVTVLGASTYPSPGEKTLVLGLVREESGSIVKSSTSYNRSSSVCIGDNNANLPMRAFLSFDITSLPPSAQINDVVLDFGVYTVNGNPTYGGTIHGNMGDIEVYRQQYGKFEDAGRLVYEFTAGKIGTMRWMGNINSPLSLNVTNDNDGNNIVQALLTQGASRCQFRIQFFTTTNWDSVADTICLEGAKLKITYTVP